MSLFKVKYWKKNKPTGTRKFHGIGIMLNYEDVLFEYTLSHLCERIYFHHYEWYMLNEHVFIKRLNANSLVCNYEISLFDMRERSQLLEIYCVEIECVENDNTKDLFVQQYELKDPNYPKKEKQKLPTAWYMKEPRSVRMFLIMLENYGNLKSLKSSGLISKATYYRNLKICEEKGIIKNGKITRRLQVNKYK